MDTRVATPLRVLQITLGLTATLAGLDKFFNILANWGAYVSPTIAHALPFGVPTFMGMVGIVEIAVGISILVVAPRAGAYVASAWLLLVAVNLTTGGHFDVAVRDVVMSVAAFAVARAVEVRGDSRVPIRKLGWSRVVGLAVLLATATTADAQDKQPRDSDPYQTAALRQDMRKLWTDHVVWTRDYIVAAVGDQPDVQAAAGRLLKNQEDIGAAVATFYGKAAGDTLTTLLKEHITIAVDIIKFAKAGDTVSQQHADAMWHRNAEAIADFLAKANPNWPRATLLDMMNTHLATTTDEVVARLTKNWDADVLAFDRVYSHILMMADALSDGIVKQFPKKFAPRAAE
jgi:hypothetical protein